MGINLNSLLDATTVKASNFAVTSLGASAPVGVQSVSYFPRKGQVKLYLEENISPTALPCRVISSGLKTTEGETVSLDLAVYMLKENIGRVSDVFVSELTCLSADGKPVYGIPENGSYTVCVRVVNSSATAQTATLKILAMKDGVKQEVLANESLTLQAGKSCLIQKTLTAKQGQTIDAKLEKAE